MMTMIVGLNGSGKTLEIKKLYSKLKEAYGGTEVVTNLKKLPYTGFDADRLNIINSDEAFRDIWDYRDIIIREDKLVIDSEKKGILRLFYGTVDISM